MTIKNDTPEQEKLSHLKAVIDACPVPIAILDTLGNIVSINTIFTQAFGYQHTDMLTAEDWWPLAYPDETYRQHIAQLWQDRVEKSIQDSSHFESFEAHLRCANGEYKTVMAWASTLGDAYAGFFLGALLDITERSNAISALSNSQQLLQSVIETLPVRVFWKDTDSRYLGCNHRFAQDAGENDPNAIIGKVDTELSWREQAALYRADDLDVMTHKSIKTAYEEPQTTPDGQRIWLRTSKVPLENKAQEVIGLLGMYEDITLQKQRENERWLNYFAIEHSDISIARIRPDGSVAYANERAANMLGYTHEELLALTVCDWDANITPSDWHAIWQGHVTNGSFHAESIHIRKDGTTFPVHISASFIELDGEELSLAFVQDISLRKQLETQENNKRHILELMATGAALDEILSAIIQHIEQVNTGFRCAIFMLDALGNKLHLGATNMVSDCAFDNANSKQAAQVCACGDAVYQGKRVMTYNTSADADWLSLSDLANEAYANEVTCWSEPIKGIRDNLLGTFTTYYLQTAPLSDNDIQSIEQATQLTAVAIEQFQAQEAQRLASLVYQHSSEAMMVTDPKGVIITINPAFTVLTGYELQEVKGLTSSVLHSGKQSPAFYQEMWQALSQTGQWQGEIWNKRKNGEIFPEWLTINTIFNADGSAHRRVALFSDITQHKATEALIWKQANFDSLTNLPNRQMFYDRLNQEIKKAHHSQLPLALLFLDLDHFKEVNDSLGHDMGDILLQQATQRLLDCVREGDTVARLGGDEFTIILGDLKERDAIERITKAILKSLSAPFNLNDQFAYVSVSIGVTLYPDDAQNADLLIKHADQAMYAAKAMGRNRYHYFTQAMQEAAQKRLKMISDLHIALEQQQFHLVYQPIINLSTGSIQKAEALLRWQHPTAGLVSPADFIPLAEETGTIVAIGDWVFLEASQQTMHWTTICPNFQMSINTSPLQFQRNVSLDANWVTHLNALGLSGNNLIVEITEGLLMDAAKPIQRQLLAFRDNGIQVSMDDFGTGYSSLSYLKKFDIDYIKIDQSFVRNMQTDSNDLVLCEAIIVMAHKLGIKVVAEGIETAEQRDLLTEMGCDYGQGYFFSRPISAEAFSELLAHSAC